MALSGASVGVLANFLAVGEVQLWKDRPAGAPASRDVGVAAVLSEVEKAIGLAARDASYPVTVGSETQRCRSWNKLAAKEKE